MRKSGEQLLPWSFSKLNDYERCPFYAYQVHVLKQKQPEDAKAPWKLKGDRYHLQAQLYVNDRNAGVKRRPPPELKLYAKEIAQLLKMARVPPSTELKWGFTQAWRPTDFFAKDVYCRMMLDLSVLHASGVNVVDYKTGKIYEKTLDQLRLYSVGALAVEPRAPSVRAEAWHLEVPPRTGLLQFQVTRRDVKTVRVSFEKRVAAMLRDRQLKPVPNSSCKYCHLAKSKGGPCPINL